MQEDAGAETSSLREKLSALEAGEATLQADLAAKEQAVADLDSLRLMETSALQQQVESLQQQLHASKVKSDEVNRKFKEKFLEVKAQLAAKTEELERATQTVAALETSTTSHLAKAAADKELLQSMQERLAVLETGAGAERIELSQKLAETASAQAELAAVQTELEAVTLRCTAAQEEVSLLQAKLEAQQVATQLLCCSDICPFFKNDIIFLLCVEEPQCLEGGSAAQ